MDAALHALARAAWAWSRGTGTALFLAAGALLLLGVSVPQPILFAIAAVLVAHEGAALLRQRHAAEPPSWGSVARRVPRGIAALVALAAATHLWWPCTVLLACGMASASAVLPGRRFARSVALAATLNSVLPLLVFPLVAGAVPSLHVITSRTGTSLLVSFVVFPLLALVLQRRSMHLLEAQRLLRETVADLERTQQALLGTQGS